MENYILDTNLFFNMSADINLGKTTEEVVRSMTKIIQSTKEKKTTMFFMPPRVVEEFLSFFEDKKQHFLTSFLSEVIIKSPTIGDIQLPAQIFYDLIDDIRKRSYRGLAVGEEEIKQTARGMMGKSGLDKKDAEIAMGPFVKGFRDRYRQATRVGFLDSLADLDLIMLAKELGGTLVSTDEGVLCWGRMFGIKEMPARVFGEKVKALVA